MHVYLGLLSPAYEIGREILKWRCPSVRLSIRPSVLPSVRHLRFLSNYLVEFHETLNKYEPLYWNDARPIFFWIGQLSLELLPLILWKKHVHSHFLVTSWYNFMKLKINMNHYTGMMPVPKIIGLANFP